MTLSINQVPNTPSIVVAGDWFVDENWVIAPHHSASSSHVGREHFRVVIQRDAIVKDLCGCGLVARLLYELRRYEFRGKQLSLREIRKLEPEISDAQAAAMPKEFGLFGIGKWNPIDTDTLRHFIHANCVKDGKANKACFSLNTPVCSDDVDIELKPFVNDSAATIRCIRTFVRFSGKLTQISRIDWEPSPQDNDLCDFDEAAIVLKRNTIPLQAVILDDHLKGSVSTQLIRFLRNYTGENTKWFVRTKSALASDISKWPDWMEAIEKPLELLVIGPETCCRDYALGGLLARRDQLAGHTFELLETLMRRQGVDKEARRAKNVILTSDKLEAVALFEEHKHLVIAEACSKRRKSYQKINWTTALFAGMCYEMITEQIGCPSTREATTLIKKAVEHAYAHCGMKAVEPEEEPTHAAPDVRLDPWESVRHQWHKAKTGLGIVDPECLQIWRAATDLPGYVACIDEKREAIRRIWRGIRRFGQRKSPQSSLSILLEADPGIGKTHLARTLACQMDCTFIAHDIAQMIHRDELLDLFDMIAAAQADRIDRPVFVFVDEINALLDDSPVYGAFLSPLEAGNYLRRGSRFQLQPCIWMFAGTPSTECAKQPEDAREKRNDFESRLTMIERIDYRSMCEKAGEGTRVADQARLEQTYMGALMINQSFSDVHQVDRDVLALFQALPPEMALARLVRRLANSLENVQYGRVHKGNCTSQEWSEAIDTWIPAYERDRWKKLDMASVKYVEIDPKM